MPALDDEAPPIACRMENVPNPLAVALQRLLEQLGGDGTLCLEQLVADLPNRLLAGVPIEQLGAMIPIENWSIQLPHEDRVVGAFQHARLPACLALERALSGHITHDHQRSNERPVGVAQWRARHADDDPAAIAGAHVQINGALVRNRFATQDTRKRPGLRWEGPACGVARAKAFALRVGGKASLPSDGIVAHQRAIGIIACAHRAVNIQDQHAIRHGVEGRLEQTPRAPRSRVRDCVARSHRGRRSRRR